MYGDVGKWIDWVHSVWDPHTKVPQSRHDVSMIKIYNALRMFATFRVTAEEDKNLNALSGVAYKKLRAIFSF